MAKDSYAFWDCGPNQSSASYRSIEPSIKSTAIKGSKLLNCFHTIINKYISNGILVTTLFKKKKVLLPIFHTIQTKVSFSKPV